MGPDRAPKRGDTTRGSRWPCGLAGSAQPLQRLGGCPAGRGSEGTQVLGPSCPQTSDALGRLLSLQLRRPIGVSGWPPGLAVRPGAVVLLLDDWRQAFRIFSSPVAAKAVMGRRPRLRWVHHLARMAADTCKCTPGPPS